MVCNREKREVNQGNTDIINTIITDSSGNPVDITGWTFWFTVRKDAADPSLSEDTVDNGALIHKEVGPIADGSDGEVQFNVTSEDTKLNARTYDADIKYKKSDGVTIQSIKYIDYIILPSIGRSE